MSKHAIRLIKILKLAVEQGLLFNDPPKLTTHPEYGNGNNSPKGKARRVYQQPNTDGNYTCEKCKKEIDEDEIAFWSETENTEKTFYNPKTDPEYITKTLAALNEAKELTINFLTEWHSVAEDLVGDPQTHLRTYPQEKLKCDNLLEDFNKNINSIPKKYFTTEIPGTLSIFSNYIHMYNNNFGRVLEEADRKLNNIQTEINKIKTEGIKPISYHSIIMEPLCEDCYDDNLVSCDWCGVKGIPQGDAGDETANFIKIDNDNYLCKRCYENSFHCDECGTIMSSDDMHHVEHPEKMLCDKCYNEHKKESYDTEEVENAVKEFSNNETFLPIDTKQIEKTILPKVLLPLKNKPFSLESIERQAIKAGLSTELKNFLMTTAKSESFSTMEELIGKLSRQINTEKYYKETYPNIKKMNNLPLDVKIVEEHDRDMSSFTITIKPTQSFIDYSEVFFPGTGALAYKKLSSGGHHSGSMAYARIGYDKNTDSFVINNLQTDADLQKLTREGELSEALKPLEPAIRWWLKQFENWPAQLLDIVHNFGEQIDKPVYLTDFDMQKNKWDRIPERNRDIYDKIPQLMGFDKEKVDMNVETLGKDRYEMYRVAREIRLRKMKISFG